MSAQTVANALISASQIDTLNGHLEGIASKVGRRSVTKVNNVTPDATGNIEINTGVLTVNSNAPDENGNININADTGVHPTQLVMSQNGVHGFRYDGSFLYIKDSSDVEHRVKTSGQSVIGTVEIAVDSGTDVSGKIVSLIKETEISSSVFDSNNEATVYTLGSGNYILHIDGYSYSTTVNVADTGTTAASVTIPKSTITVLTQDSSLLGKPVVLSDGQTGTFPNAFPSGSTTASVAFDVYTGGTYNAICKKTENYYFTSSDQLVTIGTNYQLTIESEATVTLTLNGAAGDIISIKNADNETIGNCSFEGTNTSGQTTITVPYGDLGNSNRPYTFISGVAKALDGSGNDYSKNVTLTNTLQQTVYCYPRIIDGDTVEADVWYENYINTAWGSLLSGAYHQNEGTDPTEGYGQAPTITHYTNYVGMVNNKNGNNLTVGITYFQNPIDFSTINHVYVRVKYASISDTQAQWQWVGIQTINAPQEGYTYSNRALIVSQNGTTGLIDVSNFVKTMDTSALSTTRYLSFYLRSIGNIEGQAIWHD